MYLESDISGKLYKYENDIYTEVPRIGKNSLYVEYVNWLSQPNTLETFSGTPEEIAQHNLSQLKQKETELYLKRMQDAQRIWAGLSAEFRLAKQIGQMDEATENNILAELKPVLDIIVPFGQWITGYQLLLNVGSSVIGQDLYNKLHDIIWNYIQENYEEMEITALEKSINKK